MAKCTAFTGSAVKGLILAILSLHSTECSSLTFLYCRNTARHTHVIVYHCTLQQACPAGLALTLTVCSASDWLLAWPWVQCQVWLDNVCEDCYWSCFEITFSDRQEVSVQHIIVWHQYTIGGFKNTVVVLKCHCVWAFVKIKDDISGWGIIRIRWAR